MPSGLFYQRDQAAVQYCPDMIEILALAAVHVPLGPKFQSYRGNIGA